MQVEGFRRLEEILCVRCDSLARERARVRFLSPYPACLLWHYPFSSHSVDLDEVKTILAGPLPWLSPACRTPGR